MSEIHGYSALLIDASNALAVRTETGERRLMDARLPAAIARCCDEKSGQAAFHRVGRALGEKTMPAFCRVLEELHGRAVADLPFDLVVEHWLFELRERGLGAWTVERQHAGLGVLLARGRVGGFDHASARVLVEYVAGKLAAFFSSLASRELAAVDVSCSDADAELWTIAIGGPLHMATLREAVLLGEGLDSAITGHTASYAEDNDERR